MTRLLLRTLLLYSLATLALGFASAQPMPAPRPADPARLAELDRDLWRPFSAAYAARDADAYFALHTEDLVRVVSDLKTVQTPAQWRAATEAMFRQMTARREQVAIDFRFTERLVGADAASERGVYRFTITAPGGQVQRFYGRFHTVARRQQGRWKIALDYDSSERGAVDEAAFLAAHAMDDHARF